MTFNAKDFAKSNKTESTSTARPTREIRSSLKSQLMDSAWEGISAKIMTEEGVVTESGQYSLTVEDRKHALRTVFNGLFGPELTLDKDGANAIFKGMAEQMELTFGEETSEETEEDSEEEETSEDDSEEETEAA